MPLGFDALAKALTRTRAWVVTTQHNTGEPCYIEPQGNGGLMRWSRRRHCPWSQGAK